MTEPSLRTTDWTVGPDGRRNSSEAYLNAVAAVRGCLIHPPISEAWAAQTARLIVSQLAHVHGFAPERRDV